MTLLSKVISQLLELTSDSSKFVNIKVANDLV